MKTIGITGHDGFLGQHLKFLLHLRNKNKLEFASRKTFKNKDELEKFIIKSDIIVHFAGLNRGKNNEIYDTNIDLIKKIIFLIPLSGKKKHIIFSSSIKETDDSAYGKSKKECGNLLKTYSRKKNFKYTNIIIPNVFGEFCKPNYNSFISTLSHNLVNKIKIPKIQNSNITILHISKVIEEIIKIIDKQKFGKVSLKGKTYKIRDIYTKLSYFHYNYQNFIIPYLHNLDDINLFNTYRSFVFPKYTKFIIKDNTDNRGKLYELIKSYNQGQVFYSTTKPGIIRGNHLHFNKIERFVVIKGNAIISFRKLFSKKIIKFKVNGNTPTIIDIPTYYTHNIKNIGNDELLTVFWSNDIFDKKNSDTFYEKV